MPPVTSRGSQLVESIARLQQRRVTTVQLPLGRYEPADRLWLAALSSLIPRRRWTHVFPLTPGTLLAWHRKLVARRWDYFQQRHGPVRPPTNTAIK